MESYLHDEREHTTMNLSKRLIREARKVFGNKTKTELVHMALEEITRREKLAKQIKASAGKGHIRSYG